MLGAAGGSGNRCRRRARQRSSENAWPLGPMARYSASMPLIWSSPKSAAGTRFAYEIVTTNARIEVARVQSPSVKQASTASEIACANQSQPAGTHHQKE